jgi:hypothetical protein
MIAHVVNPDPKAYKWFGTLTGTHRCQPSASKLLRGVSKTPQKERS